MIRRVLISVLCLSALITPGITFASSNLQLVYRGVEGEKHRFWLEYESQSLADFRPLFEGQSPQQGSQPPSMPLSQAIHVQVRGEWQVTVIKDNDQGWTLSYQMIDPEVSLLTNGEKAFSEETKVQEDLSLPFFAKVKKNGKIDSLIFGSTQRELSQGFMRAILGITQVVFPNTPIKGPHWEIQEEDLSGTYTARYEILEKPEKNGKESATIRFHKRKLDYLLPKPQPSPGTIPVEKKIIPAGMVAGSFDTVEGHLVGLQGAFEEKTFIGGRQVSRSENRIALTYRAKEKITAAKLSDLQKLVNSQLIKDQTSPLFAETSQEEAEFAIQRSELGDATVDSLLNDLAALESLPGSKNETSLYLKFKALVYLQPEVCPQLGGVLKIAKPGSVTMNLLAGVLGEVGHPEAQSALVEAIKTRINELDPLVSLIPALGFVPLPIPEAEQLLRRIAEQSPKADFRNTAELALGNMARNLSKDEPDRARRLNAWMLANLQEAKDEGRKVQLLLVLGNAGATEAFAPITPFLTSPSAALRSAAVLALRWIQEPKVDRLLEQALITDSNKDVRRNAAVALGLRSITDQTFQAQKTALLTDKSENVRLQVLQNLWNVRDRYPEVPNLFKEVVEQDSSKDVQKEAQNFLNALEKFRQ